MKQPNFHANLKKNGECSGEKEAYCMFFAISHANQLKNGEFSGENGSVANVT